MTNDLLSFFWFTMSFVRALGYSEVPAAGLVKLGRGVGFSEAGLRMLLSRYKKQGVVIARKQGRESFYSLNDQFGHLIAGKVAEAERVVAEGNQPQTEQPCWIGVAYEFPEAEAKLRATLVAWLRTMGFAQYYGLWIYPLDKSEEFLLFASQLGIPRERYTIFKIDFFPGENLEELVAELWHLKEIDNRLQEEYQRNLALEKNYTTLPPEKAFEELFHLAIRFDELNRQAPPLPAGLLPSSSVFREFFEHGRRLLEKLSMQALPHVMQALGKPPPEKTGILATKGV